jgi:hypothetical protein
MAAVAVVLAIAMGSAAVLVANAAGAVFTGEADDQPWWPGLAAVPTR